MIARITRYTLLVIALLILGVWWWSIGLTSDFERSVGKCSLAIWSGRIALSDDHPMFSSGSFLESEGRSRLSDALGLCLPSKESVSRSDFWWIILPLWIPIVVHTVLTLVAWYRPLREMWRNKIMPFVGWDRDRPARQREWRLTRFARFALPMCCLLVLVLWVTSVRASLHQEWNISGRLEAYYSCGNVTFTHTSPTGTGWLESHWQTERVSGLNYPEQGFFERIVEFGFSLPSVHKWHVGSDGMTVWNYNIPLWLPLIVVALPAAILWNRPIRTYRRMNRQKGFDVEPVNVRAGKA